MKVLGITGGTGSGKSTVCAILSEYGAEIIDSDSIAREVVAKGKEALGEIAAYFGKEVIDPKGELDRRKLASIVFNSREKLEVLNGITHKYIIERILHRVETARREKKRLAVIDAPVPVKHGFMDIADEIWVVCADRDKRIERIMGRSGLTREEALARIRSQKKDEDYLKLADVVIYNNNGLAGLKRRIEELLSERSLLPRRSL
ncbi:MAG: dephospho-CoA kinase [Clostridiales bacterium]|nr:dephospho-CoA kinase [Eubacteriales bacterium]MDH7565297.1 dephospho-CoA kinase [Clostridiales bacterium]